MAGLVVDLGDGKGTPKLHTTDEMDPKTGQKKAPQYRGKPIAQEEQMGKRKVQTETVTGRTATSDPDIQNLPGTPAAALEKVAAKQGLPPAPASTGRGAVAKADDDLASLGIAELLGIAGPLGYQENPVWPNGGVRVMRVRNFIRAARKKAAK